MPGSGRRLESVVSPPGELKAFLMRLGVAQVRLAV
jgi:hypothetical protein